MQFNTNILYTTYGIILDNSKYLRHSYISNMNYFAVIVVDLLSEAYLNVIEKADYLHDVLRYTIY
jgi:hypothetical protein